jgi:hypothetical protein
MTISALLSLLVFLVVAGVIFYLLWWLVNQLPDPFRVVGRIIIALVAVVLLINALLGLIDTPFIRW